MKNLRNLFEYQKFNPNVSLQARIDAVTERYLSHGAVLSDDELNMVAAAGEPHVNESPVEEEYADREQHPGRSI